MRLSIFGLLLILLLAGCADGAGQASYENRILQHRMEREMELRGDRSVLTQEARARFRGLNYFPVDSTYRFEVPLQRLPRPDTVWMAESTGGLAPQAQIGTVEIPFPNGRRQLAVFRPEGAPADQLWIPFADATNGQATYGGGRYVDVEPAAGGAVTVDFNKAYNPTCDYNPAYACPLPPEQNQLSLAVPVGEQKSGLYAY